MEFSQFPIISQLLKEENLIPEKVLDKDKLICSDEKGQKYLVKDARGIEKTIYSEVFPLIKKQELIFNALILPDYKGYVEKIVDEKKYKFLILNYYEGKNYNKLWDESLPGGFGGRGVPLDFAEKSVDVLKDFSQININLLSEFGLPSFDYQKWLKFIFPKMGEDLIYSRVFTEAQIEKANSILNNKNLFYDSKKIFTNGDFYPRNFIVKPDGKIVVIDWEARTDYYFDYISDKNERLRIPGQRNVLVNYMENHAAFLFIHMWGNYWFQKKFLKLIVDEFDISLENFQAALLIKTIEQAYLWRGYLERASHLCLDQAQIFVNSLNENYIHELIKK